MRLQGCEVGHFAIGEEVRFGGARIGAAGIGPRCGINVAAEAGAAQREQQVVRTGGLGRDVLELPRRAGGRADQAGKAEIRQRDAVAVSNGPIHQQDGVQCRQVFDRCVGTAEEQVGLGAAGDVHGAKDDAALDVVGHETSGRVLWQEAVAGGIDPVDEAGIASPGDSFAAQYDDAVRQLDAAGLDVEAAAVDLQGRERQVVEYGGERCGGWRVVFIEQRRNGGEGGAGWQHAADQPASGDHAVALHAQVATELRLVTGADPQVAADHGGGQQVRAAVVEHFDEQQGVGYRAARQHAARGGLQYDLAGGHEAFAANGDAGQRIATDFEAIQRYGALEGGAAFQQIGRGGQPHAEQAAAALIQIAEAVAAFDVAQRRHGVGASDVHVIQLQAAATLDAELRAGALDVHAAQRAAAAAEKEVEHGETGARRCFPFADCQGGVAVAAQQGAVGCLHQDIGGRAFGTAHRCAGDVQHRGADAADPHTGTAQGVGAQLHVVAEQLQRSGAPGQAAGVGAVETHAIEGDVAFRRQSEQCRVVEQRAWAGQFVAGGDYGGRVHQHEVVVGADPDVG